MSVIFETVICNFMLLFMFIFKKKPYDFRFRDDQIWIDDIG